MAEDRRGPKHQSELMRVSESDASSLFNSLPPDMRDEMRLVYENAKAEQRAEIAALAADPKWVEIAKRCGCLSEAKLDTDKKSAWLSVEISSPGGGVSDKDRNALAEWEQLRK